MRRFILMFMVAAIVAALASAPAFAGTIVHQRTGDPTPVALNPQPEPPGANSLHV